MFAFEQLGWMDGWMDGWMYRIPRPRRVRSDENATKNELPKTSSSAGRRHLVARQVPPQRRQPGCDPREARRAVRREVRGEQLRGHAVPERRERRLRGIHLVPNGGRRRAAIFGTAELRTESNYEV